MKKITSSLVPVALSIICGQELIKTRVQKVKNADKVSLDAIKGRTGMIEVMEAINNSEIALQEIVTVRDKIVAAYLDILKMPL